jgi:hypothetical protein
LDWDALDAGTYTVALGGGVYWGQRASLAGTEGLLLELGAFRAGWGFGRVAVELSGTTLRVFEDESVLMDPVVGVRGPDGDRRVDTGDYRVTTTVQLTRPGSRAAAALRFGVRLPTTDDAVGLGRDQTDFFALVAGRAHRDRWEMGGEVGIGVYGTRDIVNEQVDPLLFGLSASYDLGAFEALVELAGHHDTRAGPEWRGAEDLGEARLGIRIGDGRWLSIAGVRGWTLVSPDFGVTVTAGSRFD